MIWVARALAAVTIMMLIYALILRFWASITAKTEHQREIIEIASLTRGNTKQYHLYRPVLVLFLTPSVLRHA